MNGVQMTMRAVSLFAILLGIGCAAKPKMQKEIVQWTTEPVAETEIETVRDMTSESRDIASNEPDVIAEAAAEIAAQEAAQENTPQARAPQVAMIEEVEAHMKSDEDSAYYKTIYVSLDEQNLFRNGFYSFKRDCDMRETADRESSVLGTVNKGKRLWVDDHRGEWAKVYRKTGPAYVQKVCLQ